tara:strand:- start:19931 stop:20221 length:291 start_codon:yes stop_codon:yes gene_type:complete
MEKPMTTDTQTPEAPVSDAADCSTLSKRLADAIDEVVTSGHAESILVAQLVAVAGEAVGHLNAYGEINIKDIMYDFVRTAAGGGWIPDHIEKRPCA